MTEFTCSISGSQRRSTTLSESLSLQLKPKKEGQNLKESQLEGYSSNAKVLIKKNKDVCITLIA